MPETLAKVKRELGAQAVILGTRAIGGEGVGRLFARDRFEITAAPPAHAPPRASPSAAGPSSRRAMKRQTGLDDSAIRADDPMHEYYLRLVQNDVAGHLARRILADAVREQAAGARLDERTVMALLRRRIAAMLPADGAKAAPSREAFVGPAGAGKTTTLAKIAARRKLVDKKPAAILSLDVFRIGATQQLSRLAEILGAPLHVATTPAEAAARMGEAQDATHWLIDTPGVSLSDERRVADLRAILRSLRCDAIHLVLASCTSAAVRDRAAQVFAPLGVTDVILTKLDDAVGFGVILNVMEELKLRVSYCTNGQIIPKDIENCCSPRMVELILNKQTDRFGPARPLPEGHG